MLGDQVWRKGVLRCGACFAIYITSIKGAPENSLTQARLCSLEYFFNEAAAVAMGDLESAALFRVSCFEFGVSPGEFLF